MGATRPAVGEELMDEAEAAAYLRLSPRTLQNFRLDKKGPPYSKLGRRIVYGRSDLKQWCRENRIELGSGSE